MAIPQDFACACLAPYELNRIRVAVGTITEVQIVNTMIGPMEAERGGGGGLGETKARPCNTLLGMQADRACCSLPDSLQVWLIHTGSCFVQANLYCILHIFLQRFEALKGTQDLASRHFCTHFRGC